MSKLLSGIDVGQFFQRTNWGLTGTAELDQHPRLAIPAIGVEADPQSVYLRIEWQVLTAISAASGVPTPSASQARQRSMVPTESASQARHAPQVAAALLFGIRVFHVPIEEVKSSPELASRLARNLETMPDAVAQYKRLDQCRDALVKYLQGSQSSP
jgi:hypothetical protein